MKIILVGAGLKCEKFLKQNRFLKYMELLFVADNNADRWGEKIEGYDIKSCKEINRVEYDKILITTHFDEIKEQLINDYSIDENRITRAEYLIVPEMSNMGSVELSCDLNQCCDIGHLHNKVIVPGNALEDFFFFHRHRIINKWWHYFEVYHTFFQKYIGKPVKMLEVGVYKGGSLQMWKNYFGRDARIVGIDIDSDCKRFEEDNICICIGSQDDPVFLKEVCDKHGPFDIILDDGSHQVKHQIISFESLFEYLKFGGLYICEDTHTSYWSSFGGGFGKKDTFIEYAKRLIDELHYQHIDNESVELISLFREQIKTIHFYDSIVVFEKERTGLSFWSMTGEENYRE